MDNLLLKVEDLKTHFISREKTVRAVDGASFSLKQGETLAIVGESGCGKTMAALSITGLLPTKNCRIVSGKIIFNGQDLLKCSESELTDIRGRDIGYVFQEPSSALNPVMRIGEQIVEVIKFHNKERDAKNYAIELLGLMGFENPKQKFSAWPHQLSGGMKQRVMIAMAIASNPKLLIADEPTTSLDVTIQAQILNLIKKIQKDNHLAILFITHDLSVACSIADKVCVMYAGEAVEEAQTFDFLKNAKHPYSRDLLKCIPRITAHHEELKSIRGQVMDNSTDYKCCRYVSRCDFEFDRCSKEIVKMKEINKGHGVRCLLY